MAFKDKFCSAIFLYILWDTFGSVHIKSSLNIWQNSALNPSALGVFFGKSISCCLIPLVTGLVKLFYPFLLSFW